MNLSENYIWDWSHIDICVWGPVQLVSHIYTWDRSYRYLTARHGTSCLDFHNDVPSHTYMGHQDQDGEKVGQMSLFDWKLKATADREKQKIIHFQVLLSNLSYCINKNSSFRFIKNVHPRCSSKNFISDFHLRYSSKVFIVHLICSSEWLI